MSKIRAALYPNSEEWGHGVILAPQGNKIHYVRRGQGIPVILLHGWPGFWFDWRRVIPELSKFADVIAPDFRGFGDSDKPDLPPAEGYGPQQLAGDIVALMDALHLDRVIIAAHDIGATVAQTLARFVPERIKSLILLNPPYPGIGTRRFDPSVQGEFWYQQLHNLPFADSLIGYNRETVTMYLSHFYNHWTGRGDVLVPSELDAIIDAYSKPGAFKASIQYYRARAGARGKESAADPKALQIFQKTTVLWGEKDPVMLAAWSDRLGDYFTNMELELLAGVGHFVPFEAPVEVVKAIRDHLS